MEVPGSLLQAMQEVSSSLAVLVIDECGYVEGEMEPFASQRVSFFPGDDVTWAQQRVIMLAQAYNCPIAFVHYDKDKPIGRYTYRYGIHDSCLDTRSPETIHTPLRALLPMNTEVINKHTSNAFLETPLLCWLDGQHQTRGVENLVIMGWHSHICIPATIGPSYISLLNRNCGLGAIDYQFNVLTCQKVLNGDQLLGKPVSWTKSSDSLKFYSSL